MGQSVIKKASEIAGVKVAPDEDDARFNIL